MLQFVARSVQTANLRLNPSSNVLRRWLNLLFSNPCPTSRAGSNLRPSSKAGNNLHPSSKVGNNPLSALLSNPPSVQVFTAVDAAWVWTLTGDFARFVVNKTWATESVQDKGAVFKKRSPIEPNARCSKNA